MNSKLKQLKISKLSSYTIPRSFTGIGFFFLGFIVFERSYKYTQCVRETGKLVYYDGLLCKKKKTIPLEVDGNCRTKLFKSGTADFPVAWSAAKDLSKNEKPIYMYACMYILLTYDRRAFSGIALFEILFLFFFLQNYNKYNNGLRKREITVRD